MTDGVEPSYRRVDDRIAAAEASLALFGEARHELSLLVRDFDDSLHPPGFEQLLAGFIRGHSRNRIRYLCADTAHLREQGARLVDLARRFSSYVSLRQVPAEYLPVNEQYILLDDHGYLRQGDLSTARYFLCRHDRATVRRLRNHFDEMWQRAHEVPGIHVTGLSG